MRCVAGHIRNKVTTIFECKQIKAENIMKSEGRFQIFDEEVFYFACLLEGKHGVGLMKYKYGD